METGLKGRAALVTAASKGLGLASARALASEGCRVAMSSSNADNLAAALGGLRADGYEVIGKTADLANPLDCEALVAWAVRELGQLHVLVNNTRGPAIGRIDEIGDDDWQSAFDLVLRSTVRITRVALPALKASGGAAVVNLTSLAAHQPLPYLVLSNALRPAVVGFGKTLAGEAAPQVRVNSILTGRIETDRIVEENRYRAAQLKVSPDEVAAISTQAIPLRRYGRPQELAAAVVFLAGDAASFITGATLTVDGGEYPGLL